MFFLSTFQWFTQTSGLHSGVTSQWHLIENHSSYLTSNSPCCFIFLSSTSRNLKYNSVLVFSCLLFDSHKSRNHLLVFSTVVSSAPRMAPGQSSKRFHLAKTKQMKLETFSDRRQIQPEGGQLVNIDSWALPEILMSQWACSGAWDFEFLTGTHVILTQPGELSSSSAHGLVKASLFYWIRRAAG